MIIDPHSLRIGNKLKDVRENKVITVCGIGRDKDNWEGWYIDFEVGSITIEDVFEDGNPPCQGIPLTGNELRRLGFKEHDLIGFFFETEFGNLFFVGDVLSVQTGDRGYAYIARDIIYVHELQNAVFTYCKIELTYQNE